MRTYYLLAIAIAIGAIPGVSYGQSRARPTLLAADFMLSANTSDSGWKKLGEALGADGVLVWPGAAVVRGSAVVTKLLTLQPVFGPSRTSWQPLHVEFAHDSTLAVIYGVASLIRPVDKFYPDSGLPGFTRIGRYVAAWMRTDTTWHLAAISFVNLTASEETAWLKSFGPYELPRLTAAGPAKDFIAADSTFSADAAKSGISAAFGKWAGPESVTFAATGLLNVGPKQIAAALATNKNHWQWHVVAAGASPDGSLGWTVGEAVVTLADSTARQIKTKYLTTWRRMPDGTIRFIADGGNGQPVVYNNGKP